MSEATPWHRLLGLVLTDFYRGLPVSIDLEKDLSLKQQFLDVVIIQKESPSEFQEQPSSPVSPSLVLCDGFEEMAAHNLLTFKSHQESLDPWCLKELVAHYVNYRKQVSPSMKDLLPESDFRLYALCVRAPQFLSSSSWVKRGRPGVYDVESLGGLIRLVVVHELPATEQNARLMLFGARENLLRYGIEHFQQRSSETSTLLWKFIQQYAVEGLFMPTALERWDEFIKETRELMLSQLPPEERLKGLPPEERLKGLPPEERLKGLPPEELLKGLKGLSTDDLLAALPEEIRRELLLRVKKEASGQDG